ncbi:MAG: SusC/RagA family TonB-linked outer membrane protein [Leeuwenhoekiella sp.]|uniref:SusC/RagA family TonB-linked outer membrane protein n=1 Tax=Leeuwenhoekiella palythoae TaxID=573501 RepID=UPI000C689CA3|nr:TonB-dependent receptor [Leeuwenhoekiella palythoae]MAS19863.1 SusC/RagA family TonB-linked outer membrane protein [Leeuwenhoekiella sp.]MBH12469.1 SusC/RagA family TonB-linked outer membrane protein [Leeuwenhoekiella sp.]UBZ09882.1 TonB-dependent receptor [Leeuwenhoekiella palythoae]HBO28586.1 TonB-dependent receptor [Leeuwenhoekiella sp.]
MKQNKLYDCLCVFEYLFKKGIFLLAIVLAPIMSAQAQESKTITGTVLSSNGNMPIPGVNVLVEGTTTGAVTDFDGNFSIEASANDVLVFTYLGFQEQRITVGEQTSLTVTLEEALSSLDEVVVVGYGTQRKSDLTGAVSVVDTEEMTKQASNDVTQMMQGRVAGVTITSDGQPGASPSVRIRGVSTFGQGASAEPLYVVDGFPISGGIRDINPNDIKSIQVLKDATAGAIYGNRAANGVVIITTKSGAKGKKFAVEVNSYYGIQTITQKLPLLDREGYQMINSELLTNAGQPLTPGNDPSSDLYIDDIDTDWQDEGYKDGYIMNHNFNISGGSEKTSYFVSLDYLDNEGTLVGSGPDYKRYSFRVNSDTEVGKFNFGENVYIVHSDENPLFNTTTIGLPGGRPSLVNDLLQAAPTIPVYDPNRLGGFGGADATIHQSITLNVPGINTLIENQTKVNRVLANFYAQFEPIEGLKLKTNLQYDNTDIEDQLFVPQYDLGYFFPNPTAQLQYGSRKSSSFLIENTINWTKEFGKHNLTVLAGQTYQKFNARNVSATGVGLTAPYVKNLVNAENFSVNDDIQNSAISSLLGRVNYSFDDKYLLTANIRRDGSSKFREELRYDYFPSVGLGWKIHNEFELPEFITALKLRGGIGEVGNQEILNYAYQNTINRGIPYSFAYGRAIGAAVTALVDQDIKWETRVTRSVGIDATLFNGGVDFTAEYYSNTSNDVLTYVPIPISNGSIGSQLLTNAGSIKNSGIELSAVIRKQFGDFYLEVAPNFYTVNNEVLDIGGLDLISSTGARTVVGRSLGEHYGWVYDGIFQSQEEVDNAPFQTPGTAAGDIRFRDLDGDGSITDEDRTFLGSALPTFNYGINISARYKDFDFTIFGQGAGGNYINSNLYKGLMPTTGYTNWHEDILNRWTPENTNTTVPRVVFLDPNNNGRDSNRPGWLQKGDYFRINTISLGYTLPDTFVENIHMSSARFYVTLQNVAVLSSYKGYNPDFQAGVLSPGFDYGTYPRPLTTMLGAQLKF